jgi:hypothetical protein
MTFRKCELCNQGIPHSDCCEGCRDLRKQLRETLLQNGELKESLAEVVNALRMRDHEGRYTEEIEDAQMLLAQKPKQETTHCGQCGGILGSPDYGCTCVVKRICERCGKESGPSCCPNPKDDNL